ncbi:MAG: hypothetical protein K9K64_16210, partial [Desulfohalobiaceae bacterium]|nr:hypothetical protein [Desulfohalobiaceae bacterium]
HGKGIHGQGRGQGEDVISLHGLGCERLYHQKRGVWHGRKPVQSRTADRVYEVCFAGRGRHDLTLNAGREHGFSGQWFLSRVAV